MSPLRNLWAGLWALFQKKQIEREMDEELKGYLDAAAEDKMREGMSREAALRAARVEMGSVDAVKEEIRSAGWESALETLWQDIRYGLRQLLRNPGFTAVAVLTLALGIGINSTIFSLARGMLLAPPPVHDPEHIAVVSGGDLADGWLLGPVSTSDFADWRAQNHVFEAMAASAPGADMDLALQGAPEMVTGVPVTANYFDVLGVGPALGRSFVHGEDDEEGRGHVVILSDALWQERFAADPRVVGSAIRINGVSFTVVGVMPARFKFWLTPAQLWFPLTGPASRKSRSLFVLARLRPGTSVEQASAEMETIAARLARQNPDTNKGWTSSTLTLSQYRARQSVDAGRVLAILMAAVGLVLLIACANVAGLLLARGAARRQELAIRSALGAGRGRLIRQLISESLVLGILGGAFGLLLARWGTRLLHSLMNFNQVMGAIPLEVDANVLAFTLAISILAVMVCGLIPALQSSRTDPEAALKAGLRTGGSSARSRLRRIMVGAEIAFAVVLLSGAGILIRGVVAEFTADLGFTSQGIWSIGISLPARQYQTPAKQLSFFRLVAERIGVLPGIRSVAIVNGMPVAGANAVPFSIGSEPPLKDDKVPQASYYDISLDYFRTLEIPLVRGRAFTDSDSANSTPVLIINQELARRYFAGQDPVGQYITFGEGTFVTLGGVLTPTSGLARRRQIVGVVGNVKEWLGQQGFEPQVYVPLRQIPLSEAIVVFRWGGGGAPSVAAIGRAIWSAGSEEVVVGGLESMGETIDKLGGGGPKLMGKLMGTFAALALLLAAVGVYGVISYVVAQRTHEIGVRVALGARRTDVLVLVLREMALVGGCGLASGLAASAPLPRLLRSVFSDLPTNPTTLLAGVAVIIAAIVLLASYLPARRATKVDPMVALRYE
ncbi:MAG TPA: ABC transporter permease [Terriglobia bacterium]|nr:ABC transporter permease [Terriglobia bacterium]